MRACFAAGVLPLRRAGKGRPGRAWAAWAVHSGDMSQHGSKAELIEHLRAGRAEWDAAVAAVPRAAMSTSPGGGEWSVKDIVFHLTFYESWVADLLDEVRDGRPHEESPDDALGSNEVNERIHRDSQQHGLDETLRASRDSYAHLLSALEALPEEDLFASREIADEAEATCAGFLQSEVIGHYEDHLIRTPDEGAGELTRGGAWPPGPA
jgi:hypothetical protein